MGVLTTLLQKTIGTPFERHLKSLARIQKELALNLIHVIAMESEELNTLNAEKTEVINGTPLISKLLHENEEEAKNASRQAMHNAADSLLTAGELEEIHKKSILLRELENLNIGLFHDTSEHEHLLRESHNLTVYIKNLYNEMANHNKTISNQQSLLALYHAFEQINAASSKKTELASRIQRILDEKEKKRQRIKDVSKTLKIEDEKIRRIAGEIIAVDKKDKKLTLQMQPLKVA